VIKEIINFIKEMYARRALILFLKEKSVDGLHHIIRDGKLVPIHSIIKRKRNRNSGYLSKHCAFIKRNGIIKLSIFTSKLPTLASLSLSK